MSGRTLEEELANFLTASIDAVNRNPAFMKLVLSRALLSPMSRRTITRELQSVSEARLLDRLADYQAKKVIDRSVELEETVEILRLFIAGTLLYRLTISSSGIRTKRAIEQIPRAIAGTLMSAK
jgi:hypothetical protein